MKEYIPQILSPETLLEKAKSLPNLPGVYLYFDRNGNIIYVGKSRSLKKRVLSYFQNRGKHTPKTERLVQQISDLQTIVTSSEEEALILENEKIKLHQPKFNIRLKDDKNYPYIRLSLGEAYPRLAFTRKRDKKNDKNRYFGPYSSSSVVRTAIDTANKLFCLPSCNRQFPRDIGKGRPCLYYHLGKCMGVCTGKITPAEYAKKIEEVILFFKHDNKKIIDTLKTQMEQEAEKMNFERAGELRDRIRALQAISGAKQIVRDLNFDADVFGVFSDVLGGCINLLSVREGSVVDSTNFHFGADEILDAENFSSLLLSLYRARKILPSQILLPEELWNEENEVLTQVLSREKDARLRIRIPVRGDGRAILQMAMENAKAAALHRRAQFEKDEKILVSLATLLGLEVLPERIESIDISNFGASAISAGIITVQNARFLKRSYKSFTIEKDHPDDPLCMYEAISRRMQRYLDADENFAPLPDLILVDGATAQVRAVKQALSEKGMEIPVFGMVKDAFHKTRCLTDGERDISIAHDQELFQFIYKIQEEVHRFSISRMDSQRRKKVKSSALTKISGIGEKKAGVLLKAFGSIKAIRHADQAQLQAVKGISRSDAEAIYQYYHKPSERNVLS